MKEIKKMIATIENELETRGDKDTFISSCKSERNVDPQGVVQHYVVEVVFRENKEDK